MSVKTDPALAEYKSIIEQLKPVVGQPDFGQVLDSVAHHVPKPKRFLIKMELNRLAAPCNRRIDLRGHVEGEIKEFEFDGTVHYLDDVAIGIFEKGLKRFGGKYTTGIFEDVQNAENNFRVMHQKQTEKMMQEKEDASDISKQSAGVKTNYPADAVIFGNRGFRQEERMIYSMTIDVEFENGQHVRAVTTDLSVSGCKIKLPRNYKAIKGQTIRVNYTGLEEEFSLGLEEPVSYEIVGIDEKLGHLYPRCRRIESDKTASFDKFLDRFINGNKRRYKLNLDNTVEAVVTKGYEQYYLPRTTSLPIFIKENDKGILYPAYMLSNENNNEIARQWLDEENNNQLASLLSPRRLNNLLKKPGRVKETLVYGFTHIAKSKVYFYSATIDELNKNEEVKTMFLSFGASKSHWFVYKVQLTDCHGELAHIPLTLPNSASEDAEKLNKPPSTRVQRAVKAIRYIATVTELSDEKNKTIYSDLPLDMSKANLLKPFGHKRTRLKIEDVSVKFVNLRSETRFIYRSAVEVSGDLFDEPGATRDFSTKGMQIEFNEPVEVEEQEIIQVALPDLQKITKKYKLKNLAYEVVGFNKAKTIINLKIYEGDTSTHVGKAFFNELIENNRAKLKAAMEHSHSIPGLAEALRNIFVQRMPNVGIYMHKEGIRYEMNTIGHSPLPNKFVDIMHQAEGEKDFNLYPLLHNNYLQDVFITSLRKMQRHHKPVIHDFFIKYRPNETELTEQFEVKLADKFRNPAAQKIFVQKASQKESLFFAVRLYFSRTGRPDTDFIAKELAYVSQYAMHKAKVLEEELWSVAGVVDVIDISEEYLTRLGFANDAYHKQLVKRHKMIK
ncbi:PilZ domain-containing protein [Catenovulum sp. SM1970]|uniref:PilZ domain-containing protein n=1 Tax=Marinifaba aquimaris TaxID=2741323 RepID=UPI001573D3B9|nr:PilZ domain-containing protein [Marinifaba aquimaris]NTS77553.1 PilZ domain-containing protein [Marinifaba aquimaris]